jgi:methyltransferase
LLIFVIGQSLRYAAIRTLGRRWTVRIVTLPDAPLVRSGIYRYLRHPNYLGVALEIAAVPLLHTAYLTAILFTLANACLLAVRIRAEERALGINTASLHHD